MIFDHIKEGNDKFFVLNGDYPVDVLLYIREYLRSGSLYSRTVGDSRYSGKRYHLAGIYRCFHACGTFRLDTYDFYLWI